MSRTIRTVKSVTSVALCLVMLALSSSAVTSEPVNRVNMAEAKLAFDRLPNRDQNELYLMLIATGDFNAMVSRDFGGRLYDAIASFQQKNGLLPTGVLTSETIDKLTDVGGGIFNSWGFGFFDHPNTDASVAIPGRFGLIPSPSPRGIAFANRNRTMSVDFAFFPAEEASLSDIFARLTQAAPGRRIDMKVIRNNFFAVAGGSDTTGNYSRYIPVQGGIVGFTVAWNTNSYPNGSRLAVIMANELYPRRMVADPKSSPDMFDTTPSDPMPEPETQADRSQRELQPEALPEWQRQAQQEAEAARQAAAERLREERFKQAAASAKRTIDEASAFVKAYPGDKSLIDFLQQIASLNQTLSGNDPDQTEKGDAALAASLHHDPDFQNFEVQLQKDRRQQEARSLADAFKELNIQKRFLISVVTRNPTSDSAIKFLPLVKQADGALSSPELARLQTTIGQIDLEIKSAGLQDEFTASQQEHPDQPTSRFDGLLPPTDKNKFLMEGGLRDVVIMYNSSGNAPHAFKNLRGDFVFDGGRAETCLFGHTDDQQLEIIVQSIMSQYGLTTIAMTTSSCDADRLSSYDIVATRRGIFLRQEPQEALALVKAIETDQIKSLTTVSESQIKEADAANAARAADIATDVGRGSKDGFGLLLLQTHSAAICFVTTEQMEAHRQLLASHIDKLTADIGGAPEFVETTADGAFANAKQGRCRAIYAASGDLKDLANGLTRDQTPFRFSTLWINESDVSASDDRIRAQKNAAEQQEADRKRAAEEKRKLSDLQESEQATKLSALQEASRKQYGATAQAASAHVAQEVKAFTDHPSDLSQLALTEFPTFSAMFKTYLAQKWELMNENAQLYDYGTSDWKGRSLETIVTKVVVRFSNAMLGDYKDECYLFGEVRDIEFNFERDLISIPCSNSGELDTWEAQRAFRSKWNMTKRKEALDQ